MNSIIKNVIEPVFKAKKIKQIEKKDTDKPFIPSYILEKFTNKIKQSIEKKIDICEIYTLFKNENSR
tara:strand:+ start:1678 stop:1878 length:201 start_codon:yes stop_codon:yes gene_type:complete